MSPLRICDEDGEFEYNVADPELIRLSYSLGSVLYAVRAELTDLYQWCDEPQHIGKQLISVFGQQHHHLCQARSNREAASLLRKALVTYLESSGFDDEQCALRDRLVSSLQAEGAAPVSDPFRVIFRAVAQAAKEFFGEDWPRSVQCKFEVIGDPPYPGSQFWINACTMLDLTDETVPPYVRLRAHPNQLNFETYSSVYALLVHECFCHVPSFRVKQTNESPFSEGLCDWAAHELFGRWLRRLDPSLEDAARQFGEQIWTLMKTKGGGNKFWYARQFGHKAAEHLVRFFIDSGALDEEAIDLVITLARELVIAEAPLADKDSFVRRLAGKITQDDQALLRRWRARRADAIALLHPDPR